MFLSTPSVRPFIQNENPDNAGFRKPGGSKPGGLSLRTPFKDRSVNSVSPTSKYNSKLQLQKKSEQPSVKNVAKTTTFMKYQQDSANDIYMNDYASFKEVKDEYADVFPSKRLDLVKFLRDYVAGNAPQNYILDDDDEPAELSIPSLNIRCSPLPTPVDIQDVPLPVFNF